jgi:hypothetical protein
LEFRPSEVAAAVAIIAVAGETQTIDIETATSLLIEHVKKVCIYSHWSTEPQNDIHMMILLLLLILLLANLIFK